MVELTEISDDQNTPVQEPQVVPAEPLNTEDKSLFSVAKNGEESDEEDGSDFDDDFDENETFFERVMALKEIIPPKQRQAIVDTYNSTSSLVKTVFAKGGNLTWALTTSALLLGVPLSLSILSEQQLIEMEKTFDLQKGADDLLGSTEEANKIE